MQLINKGRLLVWQIVYQAHDFPLVNQLQLVHYQSLHKLAYSKHNRVLANTVFVFLNVRLFCTHACKLHFHVSFHLHPVLCSPHQPLKVLQRSRANGTSPTKSKFCIKQMKNEKKPFLDSLMPVVTFVQAGDEKKANLTQLCSGKCLVQPAF